MNERLKELKRRRKALRLNQEDVAAWIGKERATYTRKERGEFPLTVEEWDIIDAKLSEIEREKSQPGEVVPPCGLIDRKDVQDVCEKIGQIYKSGNGQAIIAFESGLKGVLSMLDSHRKINEVLDKLNILIGDNEGFHERLNTLEALIKTETPDENAVAVEEGKETAAR